MSSREEVEALQRELAASLGSMSLDEAQATLAAAQRMLSDVQSQQVQAQKDIMKARAEVEAASSELPQAPPVPKPSSKARMSTTKREGKKQSSDGNSSTTMKSPAMIAEEMKAAMQEAAALKAEMEKARAACDSRLQDTKDALASLESAQKEKEKLGKKLGEDSEKMGKILEEEKAKVDVDDGSGVAATNHSQGPTSNDDTSSQSYPLTEFPKKAEPKVTLHIEEHGPLTPGTEMDVQYTLEGGEWDEDDAIYLQCASAPCAFDSDTMRSDFDEDDLKKGIISRVYSSEEIANGDAYETFQYSVEPTAAPVDYRSEGDGARGLLIGQVTLQLPLYGGWYCLSYVRTSARLAGSGRAQTVLRERKTLACVRLDMYVAQRVCRSDPRIPRNAHNDGSTDTVVSRRFAGPMSYLTAAEAVSVTMYDLQRFSTLYAVITLPSLKHPQHACRDMCRVRAWLRDPVDRGLVCIVEADIVADEEAGVEGEKEGVVSTVYLEAILLCHADLTALRDTYTSFSLSDAAVSQLESGSLCVTLPYNQSSSNRAALDKRHYYPRAETLSVVPSSTASLPLEKAALTSMSPIQCASCGARLFAPSTAITSVSRLPTGIFDNMMHEFICSEEHAAGLNLCSNEITTPRGTLLLGEVQVSACPDDVQPSALVLECKQVPSLLDLFVGFGGALATAPYTYNTSTRGNDNASNGNNPIVDGRSEPDPGAAGEASLPPAVVSIDTCTLSCSRCLAYVGDALLKSATEGEEQKENSDGAGADAGAGRQKETERKGLEEQESMELSIADIRDIRFSRAGVTLPCHLVQLRQRMSIATAGTERGKREALSVESAVARSVVHLQQTFSSQSFVLHVPTSGMDSVSPSSSSTSNGHGGSLDTVVGTRTLILLRLVSSSCAVHPSSSSSAPFQEALMVRFAWGPASQLLSKNTNNRSSSNSKCGSSGKLARVTGREARVPLAYHDLVQLLSLLIKRSQDLGESSAQGQRQGQEAGGDRFVMSYMLRDREQT